MYNSLGFIFAFVALISWGFGDYFIQKTTRLIGIWKALFFIGFTASITLLFFVIDDLLLLSISDILFLLITSIIVMSAALFDFEALRQGKIAVIEPIIGLELPITVGFGVFLAHEKLSLIQLLFILVIFVGIMLIITIDSSHLRYHKRIIEKGVTLALIGAIGMAMNNFLVGIASQNISPLVTIWFVHTIIVFICIIYFIHKGKKDIQSLFRDLKKYPKNIVAQSILDNAGWIAYASATALIPISITTAISESYIALAALLGIIVNKEKLQNHQFFGIALTIFGVIFLAYIS